MFTIDESFENFDAYSKNISTYITIDLSESDTRSKLIDSLLINVLGWDELDIQREGRVDSGYFDYKVSLPGFHFLIEAKKQFVDFVLPNKHKNCLIKSIYKENAEVIDQIQKYSVDLGTQFGIFTNGKQFIFLKLFNIDGKPWKDNQCLLFNGLEDVKERFVEFYENFSKFAIINNGGFKYLEASASISYRTVLSTLIDRDKEQIRNTLSAKLAPIITNIFGEIFSEEKDDDLEFINSCFVQNEEVKKNRNEIQKLFSDTAPKLAEVVPAQNFSSLSGQIKNELNQVASIRHAPPKPIIIIGSKGSGKTTFLNYLFKYRLVDKDIPDHMTVYLDLRRYFDKEQYFEAEHICRDIIELVFEKYANMNLYSLTALKRIFYKEIQRNDTNIWEWCKANDEQVYNQKLSEFLENEQKNKIIFFEKLSKYLIRERRKRLIIIIDNADQFETRIQEKVFVFSHSLSKQSLCSTVISLREGYYHKWRSAPPFDAYESNVYHISAPKYSEVLQKRIDFALNKTSVNGSTKGTVEGFKIEMPNQSIYEFLHGLKHSLFADQNSELVDFLSFTTFPNIRDGLRIFSSFLTSGHTKVSEYIIQERFRQDNQYFHPVPIHEFIKSIGLQNKTYYHSDTSIVHNLFLPPTNSNSHFLKWYMLLNLQQQHDQIGESKTIEYEAFVETFNGLGFNTDAILASVATLLAHNFIDSDQQVSDIQWKTLPIIQQISLTAKGYYYVKALMGRFHYLDLVVQDTPIYDTESFDNIKASFPRTITAKYKQMEARINTVIQFMDYLKKMEAMVSKQVIATCGSVTEIIETTLNSEIQQIQETSDKKKPSH
ncbi:P-loop NTPase fold protein [Mucilaginibacter sp. SG564]|uniref:P-loop NTPase fold protein n=1 Tax=Mucilaginibacter sp. SG564 TaxID=2587022 RepID=UPI001554B4E8|nr:P-loop NTPase fold protein [Mucilaginibacter sp. SG564]NOW95497.1 GTPase SAR1 family protein [Mucilaginibacter sp. SG564]